MKGKVLTPISYVPCAVSFKDIVSLKPLPKPMELTI